MLDQVLVKQKIELLELVTDLETANQYEISNNMGQKFFTAEEDSNFCARQCCGPERGFEIAISDISGSKILHMSRPFKCCNCICFPCNKHELVVKHAISDQVLGSVKQNWSIFPSFKVRDDTGQHVFNIEGPCSLFHCCQDINFEVTDLNGVKLGNIQKQFSGIGMEMMTDADNFNVSFPVDLDVKLKAVLLSALFLIDFMYFEHPNQQSE